MLAQVEPGEIRARLPESPPEAGEPFADVLRDLDELLLPGITHWNHPRFFAYFAISATPPGILAELLSAALNVNAMVWSTSPAATELEQTALDWLAQLLGLPREWHGHIEDTASTSTLAALAAARTLRPDGVVYASEQANFSCEKAARLLGLEYRTVPVDDDYRMTTDFPLDDATAVIATVGTTATTSVDPVPALADRCEAAGVWLHVDAAYAGAAWICPELRDSAAGVERADSLVVNPHKWLVTPVDCSTLWTRRPGGAARRLRGDAGVPALDRGRAQPEGLRPRARPPLPCAEAVGGAALPRPRGPAGADPRARSAGAALRRLGRGRAGLGGRRAAPVLDRLLPPHGGRRRRDRRARERDRPDLRRGHDAARGSARSGSRSATRRRPRRTSPRPGRYCGNARSSLRPLGDARRLRRARREGDAAAGRRADRHEAGRVPRTLGRARQRPLRRPDARAPAGVRRPGGGARRRARPAALLDPPRARAAARRRRDDAGASRPRPRARDDQRLQRGGRARLARDRARRPLRRRGLLLLVRRLQAEAGDLPRLLRAARGRAGAGGLRRRRRQRRARRRPPRRHGGRADPPAGPRPVLARGARLGRAAHRRDSPDPRPLVPKEAAC